MRKMIRTLFFGVVIVAPLLLAPHQSKAGGKDKKPPSTTTNSVPLNEGQILLIVAGLGLGAKMIYDRRKKAIKSVL